MWRRHGAPRSDDHGRGRGLAWWHRSGRAPGDDRDADLALHGVTATSAVIAIAHDVRGPGLLRDESVFVVTSLRRDRGSTD